MVDSLEDDELIAGLELYLSLAIANPTLVESLFEMVPRIKSKKAFKIFSDACSTVFNQVPPANIVELVSTFPAGSEDLALVLISVLLTKEEISAEVIEKTRISIVDRDLDVRFLNLIITSLDKVNSLVACLLSIRIMFLKILERLFSHLMILQRNWRRFERHLSP